ncbi:MAG TPA: FISUMP domain-containing protein [Bacteroidales bacterium]|nr:FISUMP domain-containing protein [Bacteroidales bacterium]
MKKVILTFVFTGLLICTLVTAQVPQAFKYQAVIRDKAGQVLSEQNINLQITILQSNANGPEVYREIHPVTTSELGLVNIEVGHGKALTGSMPSIDWSTGSHFLRVEMDQAGGTDFELMGVSQLLSVPYALYAEKSGSGTREADLDWEIIGNDVVTGHGSGYPIGNVGIGNNAPGSLLYVAKNIGEPMITIRNLGGGGGATYSMVDDLSGANWKFKATTYGGFKIRDQANSLDVLTMEPNSAANTLYIKTGGNVGIGKNAPAEKLDVTGRVRSDQGFNVNGTNGLNDTINQVTAYDFANEKLKYRTLIYTGGILTYTSPESGWLNSVGDFITPFECGNPFWDDRDGQSYNTILIGTQCWMAENMNVGKMINATTYGYQQTDNDTIEKFCYNNDINYCNVYGGLYEWNEAMQYVMTEGVQGICPSTWHLPTDDEWKILEGTVDSQYPVGDPIWNTQGGRGLDAGGNLKETGTTHWVSPNTGATNSSGFTALPGGGRGGPTFDLCGWQSNFWSSSLVLGTDYAWSRRQFSSLAQTDRNANTKPNGLSVRCLRND